MRTTVTLTPEADARIRALMRERGLSFKDAVNQAIVAGANSDGAGYRFVQRTANLGARVSVVKALQLAAELEDEELTRRREARR
jgi:hypothetical protein